MKTMIIGVVLMTTAMTHAEFSDNFNRANTSGSGSAISKAIGNGWVGQDVRQWAVKDQKLKSDAGTGNHIYNTNAATLNSPADNSFVISALITLNTSAGTAYGGLVVNYDSAESNGFVFRINGEGAVQFLRPNGSQITSGTMAEKFVPNRAYRMTVSSNAANNYKLEIFDTVLNKTVYTKTLVNSGGSTRSNGFGGLFVNTAGIEFDDFTLEAGKR